MARRLGGETVGAPVTIGRGGSLMFGARYGLTCRRAASYRHHGRLGAHLASDECSVRKNFVYATVFSDPEAGVVTDLAPGRDASAVMFFAHLYSQPERSRVRVVTIDCHAPYRMAVRVLFPNALIVADAFHLAPPCRLRAHRGAPGGLEHLAAALQETGPGLQVGALCPHATKRRARGGHEPAWESANEC